MTLKLYSWNVNGIRAVLNKGALQSFIAAHDPDILCLQETKAQRGQVELDLPQYHEHFYSAAKKGYSGTAIFTKIPALRFVDGFPTDIAEQFAITDDGYGDPTDEGRIIAAEFDRFWVVTVYTPNSKGDESIDPTARAVGSSVFGVHAAARADETGAVLRRSQRRSSRN
jgi:exodeoxyribonuclease-3